MSEPTEAEYVLGTHAAEVERLFAQHRAWRPFMFGAWRAAGFHPGQVLLDVGCGPGAATLDLAELVGPTGRVIAVDQSRRFLDTLLQYSRARRLENIETHQADVRDWTPGRFVNGAWCRWVFSFVSEPAHLAASLEKCCLPGACVAMHEYYDYAAWRMHPRLPELEHFVRTVMQSWRDMGGEPDVALSLPRVLVESGFRIAGQRPIAQLLTAADHQWSWLTGFVQSGTDWLSSLGYLSATESREIRRAFAAAASEPGAQMVAPSVLEILAVKPQ